MLNEQQLEELCLGWFQDAGWRFAHGPDIAPDSSAPERTDYIGIANELKAALKAYTDAKGKGDPTHSAVEALAVLMEKMDIARGMMQGFDYSAFETQALPLLVPAANHILGLKDGKTRFLDAMVAVAKAFSLCGTLDEAAGLRKEIAFFSAIKAAIAKFTTVDKKRSDAEKNSALKQILDNAIISEGVADAGQHLGGLAGA